MSEYTREEILKLIDENGGPEGLDLSGKDLSGIDLGRKAVETELEKAQERTPGEIPVWYSELKGANLHGAHLRGAKLQGARLRGANLQGADLGDANLQGADLGDANLQGANLGSANLQGANLGGATLQEADLWDANLQGAHLTDANLQGAGLRWAKLQRTRLRDANLQEADLWDANLQGANLRWAKLQGANLTDANLQEADLRDASLQGANLTDAKLQRARLRDANLQEADLRDARLQEADLTDARLQEADLRSAKLQGADLTDAELQGTFFSGAWLDHTEIAQDSLGPAIGEELARDYPGARDAYLRLKQNFDNLGDYAASSWAYRKERHMEKLEALQEARKAWQEHDWKGAISRYAKVVGDQLVEWVCDYGEGIWRVAGSLIAVWVAFALIYGLIAGVWGPWQDTASGRIRYITRNPIDLLSFSLGAMTTIEPAGLGARPILAMRFLAPLEALLGIFFAGLLGFVAGNRIRRS